MPAFFFPGQDKRQNQEEEGGYRRGVAGEWRTLVALHMRYLYRDYLIMFAVLVALPLFGHRLHNMAYN